jgi:integrase/recombinase XerD
MLLKPAAVQLVKLKTRDNQSPARDKAVFLVLLHTGLRVSELVALDRHQHHGKHLTDVKRKGKLRSAKIFLSKEAKEALDACLKERDDRGGPLFLTHSGERLSRQDVDWLLRALAAQDNANVRGRDRQVRYTFLRKVAAEYGVEFAMQAAGHASTKVHLALRQAQRRADRGGPGGPVLNAGTGERDREG